MSIQIKVRFLMHWIQALVAPRHLMADIKTAFPSAVVRNLPQGLGLIPISDAFAASLLGSGLAARDPLELPAQELTPGLYALASDFSHRGIVVFVATYIHGGTGGQDALVWENGNLTLSLHEGEDTMSAWPDSSISRALRYAGVVARPGEDEFDAIGLGTHRSTEKWEQETEEILPAALLVQSVPTSPPSLAAKRTWWRLW